MAAEVQGGDCILKPLKPLAWYRTLHTLKGRTEAGAFLVEGSRALSLIRAAHPGSIREILIDRESKASWKGKEPVRLLTPPQFASLSTSKTPQGVAGVIALPKDACSAKPPRTTGGRILLLEDIQDPGNVGTLIRTAAAFNFDGVILSAACADPYAPRAVQASAGSILSLWIRRTPDYFPLATRLHEQGFRIVATGVDGNARLNLDGGNRIMLVLGNEARGISRRMLNLAEQVFRIPFNAAAVESLNVAAAGAVCMYLISRNS